MRKGRFGFPVAVLFLSTLLLACSSSPSHPSSGAGGNASGGSSAVGGSSAKGGGGGSATGGSGGNATGGNRGGSAGTSSASGGSMAGGTAGSNLGGSAGASTGGTPGGRGGSGPGPTGGSATGGTGGNATGGTTGRGGAGGSAPGGAGGSTATGGAAGSSTGTGGAIDDAGPGDGGQVQGDTGPAPTCTDKSTNGDETDTDCGGGTCPKCGAGKICKQDTDCKGGGCSSGKCADPFVATGTVSNNGNIWRLTVGATLLEVQTGGGKIVTFSLDGTNFLVVNDASTGSVFWIAPQSEWNANGWPPPSEMDDNTTFTASSKDNVLTMVGPSGTDGLSISKRFWGNVENQSVTMEYTFKNGSSAEIKKAPWEITRVYPGGLTFFPYAETPVQMPGTCNCFLAVPFTTNAGVAWFKYQKADFTQDIKGGADGLEGWAAHVNCGAGLERTCASGTKSLVLIKEWADSTTQAPAEKEVEIYANAGHNYVEFEQQGNYQTVPAGGTVVWTMHWMLRALPNNIAPTAGNADLVSWVRGQLF
jgi:hypothetical protein